MQAGIDAATKAKSKLATLDKRKIYEVDRLMSNFKSVVTNLPSELEQRLQDVVETCLDIRDYDSALRLLGELNHAYKNNSEIMRLTAISHFGKGNKNDAKQECINHRPQYHAGVDGGDVVGLIFLEAH